MAAAILDFWTSDWTLLAARMRRGESGLIPEVVERPFLKLGRYFVAITLDYRATKQLYCRNQQSAAHRGAPARGS